ncbi:MAG: GNAT family N-acetyltransferase, partial [Butyricicoccus pullicaecorum]
LCVWLDELMVDESQRSKGVGRALIAAVQEKYKDAARLRLEVTDENPRAAALYRALGFEDLPYRQMTMDRKV